MFFRLCRSPWLFFAQEELVRVFVKQVVKIHKSVQQRNGSLSAFILLFYCSLTSKTLCSFFKSLQVLGENLLAVVSCFLQYFFFVSVFADLFQLSYLLGAENRRIWGFCLQGIFFLETAQMFTVRFWWLGDGGNRVNVCLRPKENRMLITGLHVVADIYCNCCLQILGWKYVGGVLSNPIVDCAILWILRMDVLLISDQHALLW